MNIGVTLLAGVHGRDQNEITGLTETQEATALPQLTILQPQIFNTVARSNQRQIQPNTDESLTSEGHTICRKLSKNQGSGAFSIPDSSSEKCTAILHSWSTLTPEEKTLMLALFQRIG